MEIFIYCFVAFFVGFMIAWLIKKSSDKKIAALQLQLTEAAAKLAALQTEKENLTKENNIVTTQLTNSQQDFQKACLLAAEYKTQIDFFAETVSTQKGDHAAEKQKHWETKKELISANNQLSRLKAELQLKVEQLSAQK